MSPKDVIKHVVEDFYSKAITDVLIGYHFRHIQDFEAHFPRIRAFWEWQLLGSSDIELAPPLDIIQKHLALNFHRGEVGRWMKLFKESLGSISMPEELKTKWTTKLSIFESVFLSETFFSKN